MRKFKTRLFILAWLIICTIGSFAQVTTSSIAGIVQTASGEPLAGTTIKASHLPSGTVYTTAAQPNGRFSILGMRPGGPYRIEFSYVGYETRTVNDINLVLGETYVLNQKLAASGQQLSEVTISAGRNPILNSERTGASTNLNTRMLNTLPTVSRALTDFTRLTPQASGNSFAGRDDRMNSVKLDGAAFNNSFGVSTDLLPGGDAQPISLDAIQEVSVNIAPYDVRQTGFTGAAINAVTRSGTNEFTGSAYFFYRNENFNGDELRGKKLTVAESTNKNFGARFGGPIIKNKLFFFGNFERTEYVYPGNTWMANRGTGAPNETRVLASDLEAVSDFLKTEYGYDPGRYENYANEYTNEDTKFLGRIDWNISDKHKLTMRYNQVVGTSDQGTNFNSGPNPRSGTGRIGPNSISFENANYAFKNTVRSAAIELNSIFSSKLSNQFLATWTYIESIRTTPGQIFPFVDIWNGSNNYISFGTELFSYNNGVKNTNLSFIDNITYQAGKHTLTAGISFEKMDYKNSYMREGTSYYRYDTITDFLNKMPPSVFATTYLYGDDPWATVKVGMGGLYVQDRVSITDKLNVTVGLRADLPLFFNDPLNNPTVDTLKLLDVHGNPTTYSTKNWPKARVLLSPRIGFNYDVFGNRSFQVRGGTGIFTGLIPFVWFTNQPTNSGVLQNTLEPVNSATLAEITEFNPDPLYWVNQLPHRFPKTPSTNAPGTVNLIDDDFKMPKVWRTNLGADYKIPNTPLVATVDFIYTRDVVGIYQFNANRKQAPATLNYSGDIRANWINRNNAVYNPATGAIVPVLSNPTEKGSSLSVTAGVSMSYRRGFYGSLHYTFTRARDISGNPGSSAGSAWSNNYSINDPNEQLLGHSQYAVPHRVVGSLSYRIEYLNHLATTVSLFYTGSSAGRFAFTYNGDINNDNVSLDLLYVPKSGSELTFAPLSITVKDVGTFDFTPEEQRAAYDAFVENVKALRKAKGGYIERNAGILPWQSRFDLRILQDIFTEIGRKRNTLQLSLDILNVGNLINSDWGVRKELITGSQYNFALLNVAGVSADGVPTFNMATVTENNRPVLATTPYRDWFDVRNAWSMQLGVRYIF
jgi:hypothetical protein